MPNLCDQFAAFHNENPKIYQLFKTFTFRALNRGFKHLSADMVLHRIRWETTVETVDPSGLDFKINNNWAAFYARMFMIDFPSYDGFFRTRIAAADRDERGR